MDRRDENPNWQDTGGRGDRWFESEERDARYSSLADLSAERGRRAGPVSGVPASPAPTGMGAPAGGPVRGPRSGEPLPPPLADPLRDPLPPNYSPLQEPNPALREATSAVDAAAVRRSIAQNDGLYRSQKPIFLGLYSLLAIAGELLMLRPFFAGAFKVSADLALAPLLAMIAFPMLALGLYGLSTGAATAVQFQGPKVWLRTPLVYLPIALALLIAAGTAA